MVFLFLYLLWMNWKLTLVMLAILPVIAVMVTTASRKFRKQSKKIQVAMGDVTHVASETIQGYRVVRSFGGEAYEEKRFLDASQSNTDKQLRMTKTGAVYTPMLQLVIYVAMAILMFLVLWLRGDASAGDLVAYITAAGLLPADPPAFRGQFHGPARRRRRREHLRAARRSGGGRPGYRREGARQRAPGSAQPELPLSRNRQAGAG